MQRTNEKHCQWKTNHSACEEIVSHETCKITCKRLAIHCEGQWMQEMSNRSEGAKDEAKEGETEGVKFTNTLVFNQELTGLLFMRQSPQKYFCISHWCHQFLNICNSKTLLTVNHKCRVILSTSYCVVGSTGVLSTICSVYITESQ